MNRAVCLGASVVIMLLLQARPARSQRVFAEGVKDLATEIAASATKVEKRRIAVVPFLELDGRKSVLGTFLAEELITGLFKIGGLEIVERTMLDKVFAELKLGGTGAIDPETAKKVGKLAGVDAIVTGTITDLQSYVAVNCRMIDTESGRLFAAAQTRIVKDDDLRKIMGMVLGGGETRPAAQVQPTSTSTATQSPGSPDRGESAMRVKVGQFSFELERCRRAGSGVTCQFQVKNQGPDAWLTVYGRGSRGEGTRAQDTSGNEYSGSKARLGSAEGSSAQESLGSEAQTRAVLWFEYVPRDVTSFAVFDIGCYAYVPRSGSTADLIRGGMTGRDRGVNFRAEMRNVPIVQ